MTARGRLRSWAVLPIGLAALVLPAQASAHGRAATIALDYRLSFDPATRGIPGLHLRILDGDRDLEARVDPGVELLVRGSLREPLLRIDSAGVWVNGSSPTATGDGIVSPGHRGWVRASHGSSIAWHDHRLAPPPAGAPGPVGRFSIPVLVDGKPHLIAGTFFRVARPALWPWLAGAALLGGALAVAAGRRSLRAGLTIGAGLAGGIAALTAVTTFAARDAPTGGVAWLQIGTGIAIAAVLGGLLVRLQGRRRVHAAGVIGAVAAAVSLSSLPVFWHGVVISALPAPAARLACGLALVCGAASAALSFLPDFDEPARVVRR